MFILDNLFIEKKLLNLSPTISSNTPVYSYLNNKETLLSISNNTQSLIEFDNLTQGYIYYLFLKHNISLPFDRSTVITSTNFFYYFVKYKKQFSIEQLICISKYYDEKISFSQERKNNYTNLDNDKLFAELMPIFEDSDIQEVDNIIYSQNFAKISSQFENIINTNGALDLNTIIFNEDFFIEAISFSDEIKDAIIYTAINEKIEYSSINISDDLFNILAPFLIKNSSFYNDYSFKERFLIFLNKQCRILFNNIENSNENEIIFLFSLINKFTFTEEPEHVKFLTQLIEDISQNTPEYLFNVFNVIDLDVEDIHNFIFQLTFPILSKNNKLAEHPYTVEQFIENKDFIRDTIQDEFLNLSRFSTIPLKSLFDKYYHLFNFYYDNKNFNDIVFSQDFNHFLLNLKGNDIFSLFSYSFNEHFDVSNPVNQYFIHKYIDILTLLHSKTQDLFEDYFNNQNTIFNLLSGYSFNILAVQEDELQKRINSTFSSFNITVISKEVFFDILLQINKFCHTQNIFNENNFVKSLKLSNIDYDNNHITYKLKLPTLNYLNYKEFMFGGSIGVFSKQYFLQHQERIQENLISYFIFSCRNELMTIGEIKPNKNILNNMLPLGISAHQNKPKNITTKKSNELDLNDIFYHLFLNNDGLKKQSIQRVLFVYYFNNPLFNFLSVKFQDIITKEINLFLFKNYAFNHGYNFSKENIRSDFSSTYKNVMQSRNIFIKMSYLFSSPKFASKFLIYDLKKLETIVELLPSNNRFINQHIVQLLKSFYLNLSMIIDFKISQYDTPYYKDLFQIISKILLVELFETNFQRFKMSDILSTDILNYLFANHLKLNIQKIKLYPEINIHIKELSYQIILPNEQDNPPVFMKKSIEGFKKFFILAIFITDNNTVSDIIQTFYSNKEIYILQNLFESNNLMFNFSPQIFSKDIIENTISESSIEYHLNYVLERFFLLNKKFNQPNTNELEQFFNIVSETSYLFKFGLVSSKIKLPKFIENNLNEFLLTLFEFTPQNSKFTQKHINLFNIFDFDIQKLKSFFLEYYPFVFLTHSTDTLVFQFNLFNYFLLTKEEMLSFIKKTFSDIKNPAYFDILLEFNKKEPLFQNWIKSISTYNDSDISINEKIYSYFWNNSHDCPELRVYLLNFNLFLKVFSYDIEHIVQQSQLHLTETCDPIYKEEQSILSVTPVQYYLFYSEILRTKLHFSSFDFEQLLISLNNKYRNFYNNHQKNYIKSSYLSYLLLVENMHYKSCTQNPHKNYFLAPQDFRDVIIQFYGEKTYFCHFLFYNPLTLSLPHEHQKNIFDFTKHLLKQVNIQNNLFNFQLNISRVSSTDLSILSIEKSYDNLESFLEFLLACINAQFNDDSGRQQILNSLEFILFNLRLVDFFPKIYNTSLYSSFASNQISLAYTKEFRKINLYSTLHKQSISDSAEVKISHIKKKI